MVHRVLLAVLLPVALDHQLPVVALFVALARVELMVVLLDLLVALYSPLPYF